MQTSRRWFLAVLMIQEPTRVLLSSVNQNVSTRDAADLTWSCSSSLWIKKQKIKKRSTANASITALKKNKHPLSLPGLHWWALSAFCFNWVWSFLLCLLAILKIEEFDFRRFFSSRCGFCSWMKQVPPWEENRRFLIRFCCLFLKTRTTLTACW